MAQNILDIFELDDNTFDVRVNHSVKRHGGKLIANCPTSKLAELVRDGILFLILDDGLNWDVEFEVVSLNNSNAQETQTQQ